MKKRILSKSTQKLLSVMLASVMLFVSIPMSVIGEGLTIGQIGADDNATLVDPTDSFYEDVAMRDEFSKHYVLENGERYAVIFPEAVHYEDGGEWKEVDNRLTYNAATGKYVSANPKFTAAFADNAASGELVSISDGEHTVSWGISFAKNSGGELMNVSASAGQVSVTNGADTAARLAEVKAAQASIARASVETNQAFYKEAAEDTYKNAVTDIGKASSGISYASVMDDAVSLRYSVSHGKVEEDIILRSKSDFASYTMTVNTGGLAVTAETDGSVSFKTADGERVFTIDAPWMKDSAYGFSKDIDVAVTQTGNTATVTYTPGTEWLNSEDRVYPVLIDPTVTTRDYTSNYLDTYVDSTYSTTNCLEYADEQTLMTGVTPVGELTAFLKILDIPDISTYDYVIISSAQLHLWSKYSVNYPLYLCEITESWESSGFTSANIPDSTRISGAVSAASNQYIFDLSSFFTTEIFDKYHDYNYYWDNLHHGFMIESASTVSDTVTTLYSSEATSQRPIMTMTYSYMFDPIFRDMAVYNFKSDLSSKYMTVHNGLNVTGTNVYQYTENDSASQAFKLDYIESGEYYKIRAMCSSDGGDKVLGFPYGNTVDDLSGYEAANVSLYNDSTGYEVQWLIEPIGTGNLFKIISKADHNLALTVQGFSDGTASGTSTGSSGNIKVQEYTGASNQHWVIESGGMHIKHTYDISNASNEELNIGESTYYNCGVDTVGGNITWESSNIYVATVFNGIVTTHGAGETTITAKVKNNLGVLTNIYSINIVVIFENGIYAIQNNSTNNYIELLQGNPSVNNWYIQWNASKNNNSLFKIFYLGNGIYSIRSMVACEVGIVKSESSMLINGNVGKVQKLQSSTCIDGVPLEGQWKIQKNEYGYYIECVSGGVITAQNSNYGYYTKLLLEPYSNKSTQAWNFIHSNYQDSGVLLFDIPSSVTINKTEKLNAYVYSSLMEVNDSCNIVWSVTNGDGSATIDSNTGIIRGVSLGTVTVTATYSDSNNHQFSNSKSINVVNEENSYSAYAGVLTIESGRGISADITLPNSYPNVYDSGESVWISTNGLNGEWLQVGMLYYHSDQNFKFYAEYFDEEGYHKLDLNEVGVPLLGSTYSFKIEYSTVNNCWEAYINSQRVASSNFTDSPIGFQAQAEVHKQDIALGPFTFSDVRLKLTDGSWVDNPKLPSADDLYMWSGTSTHFTVYS